MLMYITFFKKILLKGINSNPLQYKTDQCEQRLIVC